MASKVVAFDQKDSAQPPERYRSGPHGLFYLPDRNLAIDLRTRKGWKTFPSRRTFTCMTPVSLAHLYPIGERPCLPARSRPPRTDTIAHRIPWTGTDTMIAGFSTFATSASWNCPRPAHRLICNCGRSPGAGSLLRFSRGVPSITREALGPAGATLAGSGFHDLTYQAWDPDPCAIRVEVFREDVQRGGSSSNSRGRPSFLVPMTSERMGSGCAGARPYTCSIRPCPPQPAVEGAAAEAGRLARAGRGRRPGFAPTAFGTRLLHLVVGC